MPFVVVVFSVYSTSELGFSPQILILQGEYVLLIQLVKNRLLTGVAAALDNQVPKSSSVFVIETINSNIYIYIY